MSQNTSHAVMSQRVEAHEEWLPISGWTGYEVSSLGRVRSWKRPGKGRQWIVDKTRPARILKAETRNGYKSVLLSDASCGKRHENIHVLVLEAFVGPRPPGFQGAHGNGDKSTNELWNLRWATPKDNNADKLAHGTHQYGESIGSSKLTQSEVDEIRKRHEAGEGSWALARAFGVHPNTIWHITSRRCWRTAA